MTVRQKRSKTQTERRERSKDAQSVKSDSFIRCAGVQHMCETIAGHIENCVEFQKFNSLTEGMGQKEGNMDQEAVCSTEKSRDENKNHRQ